MSTLHILSHSPFSDERFNSCLHLLSAGDGLLLSGDAAHALQPGAAPLLALQALSTGIKLYVLEEDAQARGLNPPALIERIDYARFVELCSYYDKVNSWL